MLKQDSISKDNEYEDVNIDLKTNGVDTPFQSKVEKAFRSDQRRLKDRFNKFLCCRI